LDEPFVDIREAAARVVAELAGVTEPVVLWGHCGGASVAVEVAALLEAAGRGPRHVVLAAKLLPTVEEMTGALAELDRSTDADVIRWMVGESGYAGLDGLEPAEVGTLARSFRHDVDGGHRYFLDLCADPDRYRLAAPITVVAAKDDPLTVEYPTAHRRWGLITEDLRLREFDGGGHYFISTNAPAAAALVAELFAAEYPVAVGEPSTSLSGKGGE
jgi:surfactin synthase thioesterase subunit